jgi:glucose-6-phosphate 1-dehydrogenase
MSRQRRYERLLVSVIAGKQWSGRIVPRAVDVADAWQVATSEAQRWEESGCPPLYE